jgi:D-glycero-D-manno-heptose 1,7-bisphosphate phosphatase
MKAIFLDRDGTLILDPPDLRVDSVLDIHVFPETLKAFKLLTTLDYGVIEITNQAGIGEGRITQAEFAQLNDKVLDVLESTGMKVLKTYMCPHLPEDNCACRKPQPTMILQAAKDYDIDLAQSWMIGDRESDIMAGVNAGTKTILVQTGNAPVVSVEATYTARSILEAVEYIAGQHGEDDKRSL